MIHSILTNPTYTGDLAQGRSLSLIHIYVYKRQAVKMAGIWLIPKNAEKPIDGRTKQGKELKHEENNAIGG